jgi:hypothetical protein
MLCLWVSDEYTLSSRVARLLALFDPECDYDPSKRRNYSPNNIASHLRTCESSATPQWEPHFSHKVIKTTCDLPSISKLFEFEIHATISCSLFRPTWGTETTFTWKEREEYRKTSLREVLYLSYLGNGECWSCSLLSWNNVWSLESVPTSSRNLLQGWRQCLRIPPTTYLPPRLSGHNVQSRLQNWFRMCLPCMNQKFYLSYNLLHICTFYMVETYLKMSVTIETFCRKNFTVKVVPMARCDVLCTYN